MRMLTLTFQRAGRTLFRFPLRRGRVIIGRSEQCDVALPDPTVSRTHAIVQPEGQHWRLVDRSANGLLVNGKPVREATLNIGDRVTVGPFQMTLQTANDPAAHARTAPLSVAEPDGLLDGRDGLSLRRVQLESLQGLTQGKRFICDRRSVTVGGTGATWVLQPELPADALTLRVVRGRCMVLPSALPIFLNGQRIWEITPLLHTDELRFGSECIRVENILAERRPTADRFGDMVGSTKVMQEVFGRLQRIARSDHTVLLTGPSGTGKELAAQAIHQHSHRAMAPFISVNCASLPAHLLESELFGHRKGAFTGADADRLGAFTAAAGGILFLDEVGELSLEGQASLLRTLESGEVRAVGSETATYPDVRVVAATNRNLYKEVQRGNFREDLLYRLNPLEIRLPPLRERRSDIPVLARTLLKRLGSSATLSDAVLDQLRQYSWPGNIRELRNALIRASVLGDDRIAPEHLPRSTSAGRPADAKTEVEETQQDEIERIRRALRAADGNRSHAAKALGIPRSSLLYRMRKLGLENE